jgi:hypothetical protein
MKHSIKLTTCIIALFCSGMSAAQQTSIPARVGTQSTASPSAYLYVTSNPIGGTYEINGYSVASDGTLTTIAGSPFGVSQIVLYAMANTAHFLFESDGTYIDSYSIASNGALKQVSSVDAAKDFGLPGGVAGSNLVLDHTGSTLYSLATDGVGDNEFSFSRRTRPRERSLTPVRQ